MPTQTEIDKEWMRYALGCAKRSLFEKEVPIGAVLILHDELIAEGWNQPIARCDPTAHAEVIALRDAAKKLNNYRLINTTLYVTLEPCPMCLGALLNARVKRFVFGAYDPRAGAVGSQFNLLQQKKIIYRPEFIGGILAEESQELLQNFFKIRRASILKKNK